MADNNTPNMATSKGEVAKGKKEEEKKSSGNAILWFAIFNGLIGFGAGMVKISITNQAMSFEKHFNYEPMSVLNMLLLMECFNGLLFVILVGFLAKHMNIPQTTLYPQGVSWPAPCPAVLNTELENFGSGRKGKQTTGMFGLGLGISMAMPAFLKFAKPYEPILIPHSNLTWDMYTCNIDKTFPQMPDPDYSDNFMYKMMMWSAIGSYGIAAVLRWGPMSFLYFDNNIADKRKVGVYLAISTCLAELSRPCGYWFNEYTNGLDPDMKEINPLIPVGAPMFVSAWWLGPMIFGFLTTLVSIPMLFLPANLFCSSKLDIQLNEANVDAIGELIKGDSVLPTVEDEDIKGTGITLIINNFIVYMKSTKRIFKDPLFLMLFVLWGVVIIPVVGLSVVNLQYTMSEYNVQPHEAEKAEAFTNFVATSLAAIVSAIVCTRIHKKRHYLSFILACVFLSFVLLPISFFLGCDNTPIHGLGNEFGPATQTDCSCDNTSVLLGCGSDGKNYKNPCHAGCTVASPQGYYANCQNIGVNSTFMPMMCPDDCHDEFVSFNVVYTISTFIHRTADIPKILLVLRIIAPIDRGIAFSFLGLSNLISSLLGPFILVSFFNDQCVLWFTDLICIYFDRDDMRLLKTGVEFNTYLFAFIMWFIVLRLNNVYDKKTKSKMSDIEIEKTAKDENEQFSRL